MSRLTQLHWPEDPMSTTPTIDDLNLLGRVDLFAGLDRVALAELAGQVDPVAFTAGEIVFHKHDPGTALYVIAEGNFHVFDPGSADSEGAVVATLSTGDYFGEM